MPNEISKFTQNDYEILNRDVVYSGFFRMVKYSFKYRRFNGNWTHPVERELMERRSAVGMLPYDPQLDVLILIEQFRPGALANPTSPWLVETVAGMYEDHEHDRDVAIRESLEEAGCVISDIVPIYDYFVSPGGSNEQISLYCGRIDANNLEAGIYGREDENEDIRSVILSFDDALQLLKEGKIKTSPAIISLQWLQLHREWLRDLWQKN